MSQSQSDSQTQSHMGGSASASGPGSGSAGSGFALAPESIPSSPGKTSLSSWWKSFTKGDDSQSQSQSPPHLSLSLSNRSSSNLDSSQNSNSNTTSHSHHLHHHKLSGQNNNNSNNNSNNNNQLSPFPQPTSSSSTSATSPLLAHSHIHSSSPPARPFLGYKSRSSHSMRPLSAYLDSSNNSQTSQEKLKQHRDSFLLQRRLDDIGNSIVFGTPLSDSINVAEGRIYISSDSDGLVVYGRIPRVIASCGLYLKKNGLDVEGIFRLSGSAKRIKQLQLIFSTAPDYGSKVDWDGFTVHDAASLFRRFLSSLPEPLIPLSLYESFREPLKSRPMIVKYLKDKEKRMTMTPNPPAIPAIVTGTGSVSVGSNNDKSTASQSSTTDSKANTTATGTNNEQQQVEDEETKRKKKKLRKQKLIQERRNALKEYAGLFDKLPELQRQLLFYILDLLAIFNSHSDKNLMPAKNLAAIFQPSILSHTSHDISRISEVGSQEQQEK
ncbi:unnamed protein product [Ambrosiozyma monospora]|uniref:Unnamed protein product n=1 Tax=Ambrosiozyma monospora TaxID=43982 RepID=A0ACB5TF19_AMBMO|nr:unnamed protein product [Ambrosiozyma monospora]